MKRCFDPADCYDAWEPIKLSKPPPPVQVETLPRTVEQPPPPVQIETTTVEQRPATDERARTPSPTLMLNDNARLFLDLLNGDAAAATEERARTPSPLLNDDARGFLQLLNGNAAADSETEHCPLMREIRNPGLLREDGGLQKTS